MRGKKMRLEASLGILPQNQAGWGQGMNIERLPKYLRDRFLSYYSTEASNKRFYLEVNKIHIGDALELLLEIEPNTVALSVWSPPYYVGKDYEKHLRYEDWESLIRNVICLHFPVIKPGGFLAINIADILCFKDSTIPKISAEVVTRRRSKITREDVLKAMIDNPGLNRYQLAKLLGCSEQTIDRRINGNNIRGGKYEVQTRVKIVGGLIEQWALEAGFYTYDRRVWVKDAAWQNSRWASNSYRSVDEFEYIYIFWKPGITKIDRRRLSAEEWQRWGSRAVWSFPSVRANDDHEAKFPVELPRRLIKIFTELNEIVLDCFMGSGTTAVACIQEKRNFIGIELSENYVQLSNERIRKGARN